MFVHPILIICFECKCTHWHRASRKPLPCIQEQCLAPRNLYAAAQYARNRYDSPGCIWTLYMPPPHSPLQATSTFNNKTCICYTFVISFHSFEIQYCYNWIWLSRIMPQAIDCDPAVRRKRHTKWPILNKLCNKYSDWRYCYFSPICLIIFHRNVFYAHEITRNRFVFFGDITLEIRARAVHYSIVITRELPLEQ